MATPSPIADPAPAAARPTRAAVRVFATPAGMAVSVFVVALVVRLWTLRDLRAQDPMLVAPLLDDAVYLDLARRGEGPLAAFMAPLHPWMLRVAALVFPLGMGLASVLNAVLGAATAAVAACAARDLVDARAGWIAGLAVALLGAFVFHDVIPGQEPALGLATVAALWCGIRLVARAAPATAAALGACAGIAALGRGTAALCVLAGVPALLRVRGRERFALAGATVLGCAAVLAGFAGIQRASGDDFAVMPWSGGPNLWLANGPESRAQRDFVSSELGGAPGRIAENARTIARGSLGTDATDGDVSSWWTARTWRTRGGPEDLGAHLGRKSLLFLAQHEQGGNHTVEVEREFATWLSIVPVGTWWILAAGIAAWWLLRPALPAADAAAWIVGGQWLALTAFFPLGRYRLAAACVCVVLFAAAIRVAPRLEWGRARTWTAVLVLAAAVGVSFVPIRDGRDTTSPARVNLAVAHRNLGHSPGAALAELRRAVEADPASPFANEMLGRVLVEDGQGAAARAPLEVAIASGVPDRVAGARAVMTRLLADAGDLAAAEETFQRSYRPERPAPELLAHGAVVAQRGGAPDEARRRLALAWHVAADDPAVAWARAQCGLGDEALRAEALRMGLPVRDRSVGTP